MRQYFIETSIIINYLRDRKGAVELVGGLDGELVSSYICLCELYEGIYRVQEKEKVEEGVLDFFSGLSKVFGIDRDIADSFGKIRAELKQSGKVIEDLDILLAATCLANNLVLVTANAKHFARINNLQILKST
jgi:predicted nucleic acid-binding protein